MIDIIAAWVVIRARAEATITTLPLLYQDETHVLPDEPSPFVYFELTTDKSDTIEIGGGRGSNRHRTPSELVAYVLVPRGEGLARILALAEPVAAAFRSYRGGGVSFEGATVHPAGEGEALVPTGLRSAAGNYSCAIVSAPFHFDQAG